MANRPISQPSQGLNRFEDKLDPVEKLPRELQIRQSETHAAAVAVRPVQAHDAETAAQVQTPVDALSAKIERVERRLDWLDA